LLQEEQLELKVFLEVVGLEDLEYLVLQFVEQQHIQLQ
jgi:hypothetical protein